jgi:hypothetical protein
MVEIPRLVPGIPAAPDHPDPWMLSHKPVNPRRHFRFITVIPNQNLISVSRIIKLKTPEGTLYGR